MTFEEFIELCPPPRNLLGLDFNDKPVQCAEDWRLVPNVLLSTLGDQSAVLAEFYWMARMRSLRSTSKRLNELFRDHRMLHRVSFRISGSEMLRICVQVDHLTEDEVQKINALLVEFRLTQ